MEQPTPDFDDLFSPADGTNRRHPLHRTRRVIHTMHDNTQRDLKRVYEEAEFDEEGFLSLVTSEELCTLDCDDLYGEMAGQCRFCSPPARLCKEHLFHCAKCGRGMCQAHLTTIKDSPPGQEKHYCPKHKNWMRLKRFLRGIILTLLEPLVSYDGRTKE